MHDTAQAQLATQYQTSLEQGLTSAQVAQRRLQYGSNTLESQAGTSWLKILIGQFTSPFMYLLIACVVISSFLDAALNGVLLIIILLNGLLGFIQEYRAERALLLLKKHLSPTAHVKRNGILIAVDSSELVPGDSITVQAGDAIGADVIFIQTAHLTLDESTLTGESVPVTKQPLDKGFMGTLVVSGAAQALVIATGMRTNFGHISQLTLQTDRESSFQIRIKRLSMLLLGLMVIVLVGLILFHILIKGNQTSLPQLFLFALSLALSITPEALPIVTTFALSRGALALAKHDVIVKRLSAIEDLGSITVLCTDKTGTLTQNKLTVAGLYKLCQQYDPLLLGTLASTTLNQQVVEPFDKAFITALGKQPKFTVLQEIFFDPLRLHNTVLVEYAKSHILIARGAYEAVKTKANLTRAQDDACQAWITQQGQEGHRVIALAYVLLDTSVSSIGTHEKNMHMAGLVAFVDPLKASAQRALVHAKKLGVTVKMLTGDSKDVACAVARAVGLIEHDKAITGQEFDQLSIDQKKRAVLDYTVFARVTPAQKYTIVDLLRISATVGYLGDGINDAPALKNAHVGIAVKEGTDIAKDAADVILMRKSLRAIMQGIELGRSIFANTLKYITTTLSSNMGNLYSMSLASLLLNFLPMLPIQILLVNLLGDLPMIAIATDSVDSSELAVPPKYSIATLAFTCALFGLVTSLFDMVCFLVFASRGPSILRTNWSIESLLGELVLIFSLRTKLPFYKAVRPSWWLIGLSVTCAVGMLLLPLTKWGSQVGKFIVPSGSDILIVFCIVITYALTNELVKVLYYRFMARTHVTRTHL